MSSRRVRSYPLIVPQQDEMSITSASPHLELLHLSTKISQFFSFHFISFHFISAEKTGIAIVFETPLP